MRTAFIIALALGLMGWIVAAGIGVFNKGQGSDIIRLWVVCKYVNSGKDPYSLARDILVARYGAGNPDRQKIFFIPREVPAERAGDVIAEWGPPEATYPPPAIGLLAMTIGFFPEPDLVPWFWFILDLASLFVIVVGLARLWPVPPGGGSKFKSLGLILAALLILPATYFVVEVCQFTLLVLALLLVANDRLYGRTLRGVALGVALLKPSLALPFVFLPLVQREWRVFFIAAAVQIIATLYVMLQTGKGISLFLDWLAVAGYFILGGMYTLQDWLTVLGGRFPWISTAASFAVLAFCGVTLAITRNRPEPRLFSLAAISSIFWTYHLAYDFVMIVPVLLPLAGWTFQQPAKRWSPLGIAVFLLLTVALLPAVYGGDSWPTRMIRWGARIVVIALFAGEYILAYRSLFAGNPPISEVKKIANP